MPTRVMPPANARRSQSSVTRRAGQAGEPFAHRARGRPEPVGVVLEDDDDVRRLAVRRVRTSRATIRTQRMTPSGRTTRRSMRWVSGSPRSSRV